MAGPLRDAGGASRRPSTPPSLRALLRVAAVTLIAVLTSLLSAAAPLAQVNSEARRNGHEAGNIELAGTSDQGVPTVVSGVTRIRDAQLVDQHFDRALRGMRRVILIDPQEQLELDAPFDVTDETRIFVTRHSLGRQADLSAAPRITRLVDEDAFVLELVHGTPGDMVSWLLINDDALIGTQGVSCWDADGSGTNDPHEDRNGDTLFTAADCLGGRGEPGGVGTAGISGPGCWDANANFVADPDEDVNGDGSVDAEDCRGPVGDQGESGEQGEVGETGATGPACWDLNGDFVADPIEDINGDLLHDTNDCVGPPGVQGVTGDTGDTGEQGVEGDAGIDCWDLDGDGVNDPTEDTLADDVFNGADCQGIQGKQGEVGEQGEPGGSVLDDFTCGAGDAIAGFDGAGLPECGRGNETYYETGFTATLTDDGHFDAYEVTLTADTQVVIATGPLDGDTPFAYHALLSLDTGQVADCQHVMNRLQAPAGDYIYYVVVDLNTGYGRVYSVAFLGGYVIRDPGAQVADDEVGTPQEAEPCPA